MQNLFTIDLGQLRTLRELRERGTITATAAALHLTPSAVSQQIAALSRSVGAPLLTRHGRRVRLTPQAGIVLDHADRLHTELEAIKAELTRFSDGQAGTVRLAAFSTAITGLVVPALRLLSGEHPGLSVTVEEVEPPDCFRKLDTGDADIAVTVDYRDGPSPHDPRYQRTPLCRDRLFLVVPSSHPRAGDPAVCLGDFGGETWIAGAYGHPCADITMAACTVAGITPRLSHRVNDWATAIALVSAGAGVALVPALALGDDHPGVTVVPVGPHAPARSIYAAVRNGSAAAPNIATVLTALAPSPTKTAALRSTVITEKTHNMAAHAQR